MFEFEHTVAGSLVTVGYGYTSVKGMLLRFVAGQFGTGKIKLTCTITQHVYSLCV